MSALINVHGGTNSIEQYAQYHSITLNLRQLNDLELLANGALSPLKSYINEEDFYQVLNTMRLSSGELCPVPIALDITESTFQKISLKDSVLLRDQEGMIVAELTVKSKWTVDKTEVAQKLYGTSSPRHRGVYHLLYKTSAHYIGGDLKIIHPISHNDFLYLRHTPEELKLFFKEQCWEKIIAFQTRNPMHRAHVELTKRAMDQFDANLLLHPAIGETKPDDIDYFYRVKCYQSTLKHYPQTNVKLSLLPMSMRFAGPKEALWHAIIRKNYGCTHLIVGRNHACPGGFENNSPWYSDYAAQELLKKYADEIEITPCFYQNLVYESTSKTYIERDQVKENHNIKTISGSKLREMLKNNDPIPSWFSYPEVIEILQKKYPSKLKQGYTVFFTGLSASGKSTLAKGLMSRLMENLDRPVTLLDGDVTRSHLAQELGFSHKDREINLERIGFVASLITKNHGITICAPIAPIDHSREEIKTLVSAHGGFFLVHVSTPLAVCEKRDKKGYYAKARSGLIKDFTGISSTYEIPQHPDLTLDCSKLSPQEGIDKIVELLVKNGFENK